MTSLVQAQRWPGKPNIYEGGSQFRPVYVIKQEWFMGSNWLNCDAHCLPNKPIKILALFEMKLDDLPFSQWARVIHYDCQTWAWDFVPVAYIRRVK
jgi:hypothetical protein